MVASTGFFSITPAQPGVPGVAPGTMPQYIQFRYNGVDLGGPDATVVDFVGTGLSVVRGAGVDANKITVTAT